MAFKINDGKTHLLEAVGLNRWMIGGGIAEGVEGGLGGAISAGQGFWDEDYTGFQHSAGAISSVVDATSNIAIGAGFGYAGWSRSAARAKAGVGALEDVYKWQGGMYQLNSAGNAGRMVGGSAMFGSTFSKAVKKGGAKGFAQAGTGKFIAEGNGFARFMMGKGGFAATGLLMAGTWAAGRVLGVAGQLLDEAHMAFNQSKYHTFDNRQFNNRGMQMWGMENQQASMQAALPFEQNMMSVARAYHSRG